MTIRVLLISVGLMVGAAKAMAQDAVQVDPKHYSVEFENDHVRVLRIKYGPREKSRMHQHPDAVAVFLTDQHAKFGDPDGTTQEVREKAGTARWTPEGKHLPENLSDMSLELVLVELKRRGSGE